MTDLEIAIEGLGVFAHHGALPAERELGQRFHVDLWLTPRSTRACETDDLPDAVDYGAVAARALAIAGGEPVALLERLAARIADALLDDFPLRAVRVRVRKPSAPIAVMLDTVAVTVGRRRD